MASKNRVVTFKLNDAEAQLLSEKVVAAGYKNKSEYFRKEVLKSNINEQKENKLEEILTEIKQGKLEILNEVNERSSDEEEINNLEKRIKNFENEINEGKEILCNGIKNIYPTWTIMGSNNEIQTEDGFKEFMNLSLIALISSLLSQTYLLKKDLVSDEYHKDFWEEKAYKLFDNFD